MKTRLSDKVYAATEQARHEKEVEFYSKHSEEWVNKHLKGVFEKRGFESYKKLRDDVLKLWKK